MQPPPAKRTPLRDLIRNRWLVCLGLTLGAFFVFAFFYVILNQSSPTWWTDSYEYAQVAQNVANGRGLVSYSPHVVEAWLLRAQPLPLPYFLHDPGQALLLGFFLKLLSIGDARIQDASIGWATGLFYILVPPLTYLFGRRAFGNAVGILAALLAIVNNQLIAFGMTGLSEVPYAFFLTCCLYTLYRQKKWWEILLSGLLFGWLAVLRSNTLPFLALCGLFVLLDPPEVRAWNLKQRLAEMFRSPRSPLLRTALFALGFLLLFVPNALRNVSLIGHPLYNAASIYSLVFYTDAIPGKSQNFLAMPGLDVDPISYLASHPDQLVSKMRYQLTNTLEQLVEGGIDNRFTGVDAILIALLLIGIFIPRPKENARQKYLRWLVYLSLFVALLVGSMTNLRWRHLYGFIPIILILDSDLLLMGLRAFQARLQLSTHLFVPIAAGVFVFLLAVLGFVAAARASTIGDGENRDYRGVARWIINNTPENVLVLSEQGDESFGVQSALAWYTGREFVEYSDFTAATIPAKRAAKPLYLLLIATDADNRTAILAKPEFNGYSEIATLDRSGLPSAALYAPAQVSARTR